jgi:hypothetical protein
MNLEYEDEDELGYFVDIPGKPGGQMVNIAQTETFADASAIAKRYGTNALGWINVLTGSGEDSRPIGKDDTQRILSDCATLIGGLAERISPDVPDSATIMARSTGIYRQLMILATRLNDAPDPHQHGKCLEFAIVLYQYYVELAVDPADLCFAIAFGERKADGMTYEQVNIHVVIESGEKQVDSKGSHPSDYLQGLLDRWLEVEQMNGVESFGEILNFDYPASIVGFLAREEFDNHDQQAVCAAHQLLKEKSWPLT